MAVNFGAACGGSLAGCDEPGLAQADVMRPGNGKSLQQAAARRSHVHHRHLVSVAKDLYNLVVARGSEMKNSAHEVALNVDLSREAMLQAVFILELVEIKISPGLFLLGNLRPLAFDRDSHEAGII
jgi:hypothetical protein